MQEQEQEEPAPSAEQVQRARYPSRVDRAVSAIGWYVPEVAVLLGVLLAGWLVWTPLVMLAGLATVARLAYHPVRRRLRQRPARAWASGEQQPARQRGTGRAAGERDEGVAV